MALLAGKIAIITGGGSGIGKGIARHFVNEGATVVLASRNKLALESTASEICNQYGKAIVIPTDISNESQVDELFSQTERRFGRLDLLVNNSGAFEFAPLDEMCLDQWNQLISVNLTGVFLCTRLALRMMKKQGSGRIINIGSISAEKPRIGQGGYGATKAAVKSLTLATALEGRPHGVSAGCISPGLVDVSGKENPNSERPVREEPSIKPSEIARIAVTMASLPQGVSMLDTTILPTQQIFIGRG